MKISKEVKKANKVDSLENITMTVEVAEYDDLNVEVESNFNLRLNRLAIDADINVVIKFSSRQLEAVYEISDTMPNISINQSFHINNLHGSTSLAALKSKRLNGIDEEAFNEIFRYISIYIGFEQGG